MSVWRTGVLGLCLAGGAAVAAAQSPGSPSPSVPAGYAPPAGMCRVWLRDVPPVQQPAPTDCRSALRTKPVGATVIYGPEPKRSGFTSNDWSRTPMRPARDDERVRAPFRTGSDGCTPGGCDDAMGTESCGDSRDLRCDEVPTALPAMRSAVLWTEGQRPADLQRWFGGMNVAARFTMPSRGGAPDRVQWFDMDGRIVQIWTDRNGDGRADRVELFNPDGTRIRVIGQ